MRSIIRTLLIIASVFLVQSCGGSTQPTPVANAVNGVWKGTTGSVTFTVDIHSVGESGIILGSGTETTPTVTRQLDVEGAFTAPDMSLHMVATGFEVFFSGTTANVSMTGTLQGSVAGFNGQSITFQRQ